MDKKQNILQEIDYGDVVSLLIKKRVPIFESMPRQKGLHGVRPSFFKGQNIPARMKT
jgi:hypothetical protein